MSARARGVTDPPDLTKVPPALSAVRKSRLVYWSELGEYVDTPVLQIGGSRIDDSLRGPLLVELPDTVVVLRPGQTARFDDFGSLVIDV